MPKKVRVKVNLDSIYLPSDKIVARKIQSELIIIPITSGIGDLEDEIFTLNKTGKAIWDKLDEKKTLKDVIQDLIHEYDIPLNQIEEDVKGFVGELLKRGILIEVKK